MEDEQEPEGDDLIDSEVSYQTSAYFLLKVIESDFDQLLTNAILVHCVSVLKSFFALYLRLYFR